MRSVVVLPLQVLNPVERCRKQVQEREKWWKIDELLLTLVTNEIDFVTREEVEWIATEQIDHTMQYFMPQPASCECIIKVKSLEQKLTETKHQLVTMTKWTEQTPRPFCEESLVRHEFTKLYTGLPNAEAVKAVFAHVSKTMPSDGITPVLSFMQQLLFYHRLSVQAQILLAEIMILPCVLFTEFVAPCEPFCCTAYSNDLY